jgi:4-hydroxybenzoate polyprenyltransferase
VTWGGARPGPSFATLRPVAGALRLIRVENCFLAVATAMIGYESGRATRTSGVNQVAIVLIVGLAVAYGNVVNDLVDEKGDRTTKPRRPIVSGLVSRRQAWSAVVVLPLGVMVLGAIAARRLMPFIACVLVLSTLYTVRLKGMPFIGNLSVGLLAGSTFLFGASGRGRPTRATVVGSVLITVAFLCFELAKTIEDADADAAVGLTTAAHVLSPRGQRWAILTVGTVYCCVVIALGVAYESADSYWFVILPVLPLLGYAVAAGRPAPRAGPPIQPFIRASKLLWCLGLVGLLSVR